MSNCAILLCFTHYMGKEDFKEEVLCCINLPGHTTGSEVFRLLNMLRVYGRKCALWHICSPVHKSVTSRDKVHFERIPAKS